MSPSRWALVVVGLVAVLVVTYLGSVLRLTEDCPRSVRHLVPGEMLVVQLRGSWDWLRSSDDSVVAPISVSLKPTTVGYFVAIRPGKAAVEALFNPCPVNKVPRCMAPAEMFAVEIDVWPD